MSSAPTSAVKLKSTIPLTQEDAKYSTNQLGFDSATRQWQNRLKEKTGGRAMKLIIATATFTLLAFNAANAQSKFPAPGAPQMPIYQPGLPPGHEPMLQPPPPPALPTLISPQQPTYIVPAGPNGFAVMQNGKTVNCFENPYAISCQ
jgi:hypothetical protein